MKLSHVSPSFLGARPNPDAGAQARRGAAHDDALITQGTFVDRADAVVFRHARSRVNPLDRGHAEPLAGDAEGADVAFTTPDIDEVAGYAGRVRFLGPLAGRVVMGVGAFVAVHAAEHAFKDVRAALADLRDLRARRAEGLPPEAIRDKPRKNVVALAAAHTRALTQKTWAVPLNAALFAGSVGMAVNLLASAELLGAFFAPLAPVAEVAMQVAVPFMALYGGLVAARAGLDIAERRRDAGGLRRQVTRLGAEGSAKARLKAEVLRTRLAELRRANLWDAGLFAAGAAQAVGAVLQFVIGPAGLLVLLPGTLALGWIKFKRDTSVHEGVAVDAAAPTHGKLALALEMRLSAETGTAFGIGRSSAWKTLRHKLDAAGRALEAMTRAGRPAAQRTRHIADAWCAARLAFLEDKRAYAPRSTQAALAEEHATVTALRQDMADTEAGPADAARHLTALLLKTNLFRPFAAQVMRDRRVARLLEVPGDGAHYVLTADHFAARLGVLPPADARWISERLYRAANEVFAERGAFAAAQSHAFYSALLTQRYLVAP
jgi:hypothetical protein